ncbi:MAG: DUF3006 domain-containing protein [Oscillospiraceae bacterium]|jgi:hypothetical protein|nr:DUF3006 domain-containing protein [Oscillospiraceae bacterium]
MKTLKINRMENGYAICEDTEKPEKSKNKNGNRLFAIPISELPQGAQAGSRITVDDETGTLAVQESAPSGS